MAKLITYDEEARHAMKRGIDALSAAVVTTLGPKGRNVALDKKYGAPTVTHDGVTVARDIELDDPFENIGDTLLKEAATPVKGHDDVAQVATISAADAEIGNLIAEVMDKVGKDGVITVEES